MIYRIIGLVLIGMWFMVFILGGLTSSIKRFRSVEDLDGDTRG